jgi:xylose isomerase
MTLATHPTRAKDSFSPRKEDKFTFGLWTVGNPGRDPFGNAVRSKISVTHIVEKLSALGAWGINLHDNDLVPFGASAADRDRVVKAFKQVLKDNGMVVPMATTNLFTHPIFKDGAFTSTDPNVRAFALQKTMQSIDLGAELGAKIYVMWGGREGTEVDASKDPVEAIKRYREALDFLCEYVRHNNYDLKFALEAKPNEPRSDMYLPTTGHMLAFIETLAHPGMVGVNPEVAHEHMSGLNFHHGVAQALERGKLFHIDLNDQKGARYDQDLRFGSENLKAMFFLVLLLEEHKWNGPRHFDAHPYRTEDEEGVWDFALGCMRTYNILRDKVRRFQNDHEIQSILRTLRNDMVSDPHAVRKFSPDKATALKERSFDVEGLAARGMQYERLDQLVVELLLGVR